MADMAAARKELKELEEKRATVVGLVGHDYDFEKVSADILPGETNRDKATEFGRMTAKIADLSAEISIREASMAQRERAAVEEEEGHPDAKKATLVMSEDQPGRMIPVLRGSAKGNYQLMRDHKQGTTYRGAYDTDRITRALITTTTDALSSDQIVTPLRPMLTALDFLTTVPTTEGVYHYIRTGFGTRRAAPRARGATVDANPTAADRQSETIETIMSVATLPREAVNDIPRLSAEIDSLMLYDVRHTLMSQAFTGDASGNNLSGIEAGTTATEAGVAGQNAHRKLMERVATMITDGAEPVAIFGGADSWATVVDVLMKAGQAAGVIAGVGPGMGMAGNANLNIIGVPWVLTPGMTAGTVIVYGRRSHILVMREMAEVAVSDEADFENNNLMLRGLVRAAVANEIPAAAYKYTAFTTFAGDYS